MLPIKYTAEELAALKSNYEHCVERDKDYLPSGSGPAEYFNDCVDLLESLKIPFTSITHRSPLFLEETFYRANTLLIKGSHGKEYYFYTSSSKWRPKGRSGPTYRSKSLQDFIDRFLNK